MTTDQQDRCPDDLLELFVLGDLDQPQQQAVAEHLAHCPTCQAQALALGQTIDQLRAARPATQPSPLFARRLAKAIESEFAQPVNRAAGAQTASRAVPGPGQPVRRASPGPGFRRRLLLLTAPLAALLMLGLATWLNWDSLARRDSASRPAAVTSPLARLATGSAGTQPTDDSSAAGPAIAEVWQLPGALPAPAAADEAVIVRGQQLYLVMNDQGTARAAALDASARRVRWMSQIECRGNLAVDGDRVYCLAPSQGSGNGQGISQEGKDARTDLVALRETDGQLLWRVGPDGSAWPDQATGQTGGQPPRRPVVLPPCRPVVLPGDRICWTTDTSVLLIRGRDGQLVWRARLADVGPISAARLLHDRLYVATGKALLGLSLETGERIERIAWPSAGPAGQIMLAGGSIRPLLDVAGDRLIASIPVRRAATIGSLVISLAPGQEQPVWSQPMPLTFHLLATAERIYLRAAGQSGGPGQGQLGPSEDPGQPGPSGSTDSMGVYALDIRTGQPLWQRPAQGCSPVTADNGTIYFLDASKNHEKLLALDGRTGTVAWQFAGLYLKSCDAFVPAGRTGYIRTQDGVLRAMSLASR